MKFHKSLHSRARGDQILRRDPPRPPRDNTKVLENIYSLYRKGRREMDLRRYGSAVHLLSKAIKLARSIDFDDPEFLDDISHVRWKASQKATQGRMRAASHSPMQQSV